MKTCFAITMAAVVLCACATSHPPEQVPLGDVKTAVAKLSVADLAPESGQGLR